MTVATAAGCDVLTYNETCTFNVVWTIPAGATDPYVNVVEATYQVDGFPNTYTHAASHSVNLFAPCINLTKTGDELSKIGDPITYDITLENCSTPNTPALTCMITDPLFPAGFTVPSACSTGNCSFSFDYTPVAADHDPLVNTASVACTIAGFPNTVGDEASATTNLPAERGSGEGLRPAVEGGRPDCLRGDDPQHLVGRLTGPDPGQLCGQQDAGYRAAGGVQPIGTGRQLHVQLQLHRSDE